MKDLKIIKSRLEILTPEKQWGDEIFFDWIENVYFHEVLIPNFGEEIDQEIKDKIDSFDALMWQLWKERKDNPAFEKDWSKAFAPMWEKINKSRKELIKDLEDYINKSENLK